MAHVRRAALSQDPRIDRAGGTIRRGCEAAASVPGVRWESEMSSPVVSLEPPRTSTAILGRIEDLAIVFVLAAMAAIPVAESLLRATLGVGISGASSIVQHLTLIVGMAGGAI